MWGLWFFPLVALLFLGGLALAAALAVWRKPRSARGWVMLAALPVALPAIPVIGLFGLGALASAFAPTDTELFEELYGRTTTLRDDQMLFDEFYSGAQRELWFRAEPDPAQRNEVLAIPGLQPSSLTPEDFAALGGGHGFSWWFEPADSPLGSACLKARISRADKALRRGSAARTRRLGGRKSWWPNASSMPRSALRNPQMWSTSWRVA